MLQGLYHPTYHTNMPLGMAPRILAAVAFFLPKKKNCAEMQL